MSKRIISVLLSVLLVVLMFGCSNSPAAEPVATDAQATDAAVQSETAEATAAPSTESRGTLTIMVGSADAGATALKAMLGEQMRNPSVECYINAPYVLVLCVIWTLFFAGWFLLGLPWGPG